MKISRLVLQATLATIAISSANISAQDRQEKQTPLPIDSSKEHVLLVMTDGLRWQEVFRGADPKLLTKANNNNQPVDALEKLYLRSTLEESRTALMPFLWSHMVPDGEIYGNRDKGSEAYVTNGLNFSYPGYSETLTGHPDPRITSNDNIPNPNVTVLEWLNREWHTSNSQAQNQTAAFGAWNTISGIVNQQRCGFTVNAGYNPLTSIPVTPQLDLLNHFKAETPRIWDDEPFDAPTFYTAVEFLKAEKPRLLFLFSAKPTTGPTPATTAFISMRRTASIDISKPCGISSSQTPSTAATQPSSSLPITAAVTHPSNGSPTARRSLTQSTSS